MKKILTAAALLVCAASFGQNLNPTVEVTNIYQGNPTEVHKPQTVMAIPDSLMRFDMDFGYEVFEKPYQGAYNFKPYMLEMTPDKDAYRGRKLYLRGGAGYSLHPQLDFVFSPEQSGPFQMSVYARHRSYFGKYHSLHHVSEGDVARIEKIPGESFGGYDALSSAGLDGRYSFNNAILSFGLGYEGIMRKDSLNRRSFNAADLKLRVRSNRDDDTYLYYDVALDGRIGRDHGEYVASTNAPIYNYWYTFDPTSSFIPVNPGQPNLNETLFFLHGEAGPVLSRHQRVIMGFEAERCSYRDLMEDRAGRIAAIPSYRFQSGKWDLNLGVRVEKLFMKDDEGAVLSRSYKGNWIFPAVKVSYSVTDNVRLFASATGGNSLNTYSSILSKNHFTYAGKFNGLFDNSTERINARIGAWGNLGPTFQFEIDGGAAVHGNGILDAGIPVPSIIGNAFLPAVVYADYSLLYADALFDLKVGGFKLDGGLHVRHSELKEDGGPGLMLPTFSTDLKAVYNFNSRLYAGVNLISASSRKGVCSEEGTFISIARGESYIPAKYSVKIPGYLDLGLLAGYQFNRKLGFWLESGNLLCETIQRNPFYSEKDLWVTAGITLNL